MNTHNMVKVIKLNNDLLRFAQSKIALELDRKFISSNILRAGNELKCNQLKSAALRRFNKHKSVIAKCNRDTARIHDRIVSAKFQYTGKEVIQ